MNKTLEKIVQTAKIVGVSVAVAGALLSCMSKGTGERLYGPNREPYADGKVVQGSVIVEGRAASGVSYLDYNVQDAYSITLRVPNASGKADSCYTFQISTNPRSPPGRTAELERIAETIQLGSVVEVKGFDPEYDGQTCSFSPITGRNVLPSQIEVVR